MNATYQDGVKRTYKKAKEEELESSSNVELMALLGQSEGSRRANEAESI